MIESSRPVAQVARELGILEGTLGSWVAAYRREHAGEEPQLSLDERARLGEVERELREVKMENELLKRCASYEPYELPVMFMCARLRVSRSGFYEWRNRTVSARARRRADVSRHVVLSSAEPDQTYGYRRVHAELGRWDVHCSPELVRPIMRELGLAPCQPRPWRHSLTEADADAGAGPVPDLANRDLTADTPGAKMVGDITYVPTWEGWLFVVRR